MQDETGQPRCVMCYCKVSSSWIVRCVTCNINRKKRMPESCKWCKKPCVMFGEDWIVGCVDHLQMGVEETLHMLGVIKDTALTQRNRGIGVIYPPRGSILPDYQHAYKRTRELLDEKHHAKKCVQKSLIEARYSHKRVGEALDDEKRETARLKIRVVEQERVIVALREEQEILYRAWSDRDEDGGKSEPKDVKEVIDHDALPPWRK